MNENMQQRCRLVLGIGSDKLLNQNDIVRKIEKALESDDVASVIIDATQQNEIIEKCVRAIQKYNVAAIVYGDVKDADELNADGVQCKPEKNEVKKIVGEYQSKIIVGAGGVRTRHQAMEIAECEPDYIMFGNINGDTHQQPNLKNLELGEWYAQWSQIPCVIMAGQDVESVIDVAKTGAEFVALDAAVFDVDKIEEVGEQVKLANKLLEQHAPKFYDEK